LIFHDTVVSIVIEVVRKNQLNNFMTISKDKVKRDIPFYRKHYREKYITKIGHEIKTPAL